MKSCHVESAYIYLRGCRPFSKWKLPPQEDVIFRVFRSSMLCGDYEPDPHTIRASCIQCRTEKDLLETVAHEMVHLALEIKGDPLHAEHLGMWNRYAQKVCDEFGWDWRKF